MEPVASIAARIRRQVKELTQAWVPSFTPRYQSLDDKL